VPVLDGTAERIPLGDACVHAVVVGQAFHWFDADAALAEIGRILRPRGGLALVWNTRDETVPWVARFGRILHAVEHAETPSARDDAWKRAFERSPRFDPVRSAQYPSRQRLTPDGLVERALSVSYIAALPTERRARIVDDIRTLLREDPALAGAPAVELPYVTDVYWTRLRGVEA
jgi:SAM-dependent methyltransferase